MPPRQTPIVPPDNKTNPSNQVLESRFAKRKSRHTKIRTRRARFEQLEARQLMVAAIWTNVLQPYDVTGDSDSVVTPIDALRVISELTIPVFSNRGAPLPLEIDGSRIPPFFDVNCDGYASPLDALLVITRIQFGDEDSRPTPPPGQPTWRFSNSGGSANAQGKIVANACSPKLIEGDSLKTELAATVRLQNATSAIKVQFEAPVFDSNSLNSIRDAFEIVVTDESGQPLILPFESNRQASFNWSEGLDPSVAPGTSTASTNAQMTATFNLTGVPAGTKVRIVARLLNNDADTTSSITLGKLEVVPASGPAPTGMAPSLASRAASFAINAGQLVDVSSSIAPSYGRTTLLSDTGELVTNLQLKNLGSTALSDNMIVAIDNLTDPTIAVLNPDGFLPSGQPYLKFKGSNGDGWLASGQSTSGRELRFKNPTGAQFNYTLRTYTQKLNSAPSGFSTSPLTSIAAGSVYSTDVNAIDPDGQQMVYSKLVGPASMSIDSASGTIRWATGIADIGNQSVVVRATDPFGLFIDQSFSISVLESLTNRPPIFTSTPLTESSVARPFEVLTFQTGVSPIAAAAGDFGTGQISIITANPGEQQLGLLSGTGKEKFGSTQAVSVGEINPSKFSTPFITGAAVDLGLAPNTYTNNERNILSVINGDVNGDGFLDFAAAINSDIGDFGSADIGSVGVRLGKGDGTFRDGWQVRLPAVALGGSGVSSRADSIRFGDVNGDSRPDLVVVQSLGSRALVYVGKGDGTFENAPIESVVNETFTYSFSSQLGDMNNDGKLDLVTYEYQRDGRFRTGTHIRLGDGTGRFANGTFYANPNNNTGDGYLADVNGDGSLDTIRINYSDTRIETRLNNGAGALGDLLFSQTFFVEANNVRGPLANPMSGYLGDYNRDGKTDIVIATATTNFILLTGNDDGTFGDGTPFGNRLILVHQGLYYANALQNFPAAGRNDGKAPDLNADGIPDFVFGNANADQLTTAINDGAGNFTTNVYQSGFSDDIGNGSVRGANPTQHISIGDFNGDGVGDVLLGRDQSSGSNVRVGGVGIALGGNEPGSLRLPEVTFSGSEDIAVGNGNQVLADFDNDGIPDVASNIRSGVAIAKGRADGTFEEYQTGYNQFGVFPYATFIASDFDRDGNMDTAYLASLNNPGHAPSMTTLFGLGNGTFQRAAAPIPPLLSGTGASSGTISQQYGVAGDVNGDGFPDLVYRIPNNHSNFATAKSLVVYLFDPATRNLKLVSDRDNLLFTQHRGGFYQDEVVAFEDLNGDGKVEIIAHSGAIGQNGITDIPERLTIWQPTNNTNGTDAADLFTRTEFVNPGISPGLGVEGSINSLLVHDFNRDGKPDMAVGSQNGTTTVLMGNGDFTFRLPVTYSTNQVTGVKTADVNGDGNLDIVPVWSNFFNFNDLNNAGVLLGRSDGSFGSYDGLTTSAYELNSPLIGDFNQDGRDDINFGNYSSNRLTVLAASPGLASVAAGDVNGDGKLDVVSLDTGFARLKVLLGNGDDTFNRQKDLVTGLQPESLVLKDMNGDGNLDILTANRVSKSISLFTNNGTGVFTRLDLALPSQPNRIAVGDLNGDGKSDIIATSEQSESLLTLLSNGSSFAAVTEQPIGFAAVDAVMADLTLDGKLDVILSDSSGKRIMTLPGQGNGTFGVPIVQPLQLIPDKIAAADLNADGKPDIIATFPNENQVGVLFGRGAGRLTSPQSINVGNNPASIVVKDINGDSKPDLLITNSGDNTLSVVVNRYDPTNVFRYNPTATDPDADPIAFELLNAPGGALYDEATRSIVWAPMPDQVGANAMVVRASDGRGGFAEQGFTVTVTQPEATISPSFTSEPIAEFSSDQAYVYQPRISNPSNAPVRYSFVDAPEGATIDPTTGIVNWDPRENGLSLGVRGSFNFPNNVENRGAISIPASPSINSVSFTAEGWYKFDSLDNATLFRKYHSGFYNSWTLGSFFGTLRAEINNFGNTPDVRLDTIRLTTNTWYHIAFSYDDTTRLAQMFVNGELVGSVVSTGTPILSNEALSVDGFEGTVANMRFWNRGLSSSEVKTSMLQMVPSNATGLVIDYHFSEGPVALSFVDASPFGNHGKLFINGNFSRYNFPERIPSIARSATVPFTIRVEDGKGGSATQSFSVTTLPPFPKAIQGTVFDDVNGNGVKDGASDPGLVGQVVYVDQNGNHQLDTSEVRTTTDAAGNYSLSYIGSQASVALVGKPGRVQSTPAMSSQMVDLANGNASGILFGTKAAIDGKPVFVTVAPTNASVPGEYRYQAYAQSTDGSPIEYAIAVAPTGASIDAMSGMLKWMPRFSDAGPVDVIIKATDGAGRVALQSIRINVSVNTAPVITSVAASNAAVGVLYHYDSQAQDAEQSTLSYTFEQSPTGATIDSTSGMIRWTPVASQLGSQSFTVVVSDGKGQQAKQSFGVNVTLPTANSSPLITSGPRLTAQVGTHYRSTVLASDPDNDLLTYSMITGPIGASISSDGLITWLPKELGPQSIRVHVSDNRGGTDEKSYTINVGSSPENVSIRFTSSPISNAVAERVYAYDAFATGAKQYQLLAAPVGLSIDPVLGRIRWQPTAAQLGLSSVRVQAIDEMGNSAEQSFSINVRRSDLLPTVTSVPSTQSAVGSTYVYLVQAENPSGNPLVYSLSVAPSGMSINAQTGVVSWTPTASQVGSQSVVLRVTDGAGNFLTQSFAIQVTANSPNRQPVATSTPPEDAIVGAPIGYRIVAVDPDGDALVYSVVSGPSGLTINPTTGVVTWIPTTSQIGTAAITLKASDQLGAAAVQSFVIDVRGANQAPSIISVAPKSVPQGGLFRYDVIANDADRELLFFELLSDPQGMTIDTFGRIRWQTTLDTPLGDRPVSVRVNDGRGGSALQDFSLKVVADTTAPRITILTSSVVLSPFNKGPSVVKVQAVDDVSIASLQLFVDGQALPLRSDGTADVYFSSPGNGRLLAYAFDPAGNRGSATNRILMCSGEEECIPDGTSNQPQTIISNINDGDSVTGLVKVNGTASATDFESYALSYRRSDQTAFTTISSSTTAINNGLIGTWDTTLLENDSYVLRLEARDKFGGYSAVERSVGVSGNLKLGNFRLSFTDMTIPVAGIPITVARTYDTLRSDRSEDFGFGWRMEFRNTDLRTSLPKTGLEEQGIYTPFKPGTKVYLTLPGGQREGFTFTPDIRVLPGFGGSLVIATPRFTADRGVKNTLSAGSGNLIVNERGELFASGGIPWNPGSPDFAGYTLTTPEGTQFRIDGNTGDLISAADRNGVRLDFSDSGVTSSAGGVSVKVERDGKSRITRVIDPAGAFVSYTYDSRGDLVSVSNRVGGLTQFIYRTDRKHYLEKVIDPMGRDGVRTEYGPDGRLVGMIDAKGGKIKTSYDPNNNLVSVTDALGHTTINEYDQRGNIVTSINPLGNSVRFTFDSSDNLTSETNALGHARTYEYDAFGNLVSSKNALGQVTRYTFDAFGQPTAIVNAVGETLTLSYDKRGNLHSAVEEPGYRTTYTVDAFGNTLTSTDAAGIKSINQYDARGNRTLIATDFGEVASMTYNSNGLMTSQSSPNSPAWNLVFDAEGNATSMSVGTISRTFSYDASGQMTSGTAADGGIVNLNTDATGGLTEISAADGTGALSQELDAVGNVTAIIDKKGLRTTYNYDAANRKMSVNYPDGTSERFAYDAADQLTSLLDRRGIMTSYSYDADGNLIGVKDSSGQDTVLNYDAIGRLISKVDANGWVLESNEYEDGQLKSRIAANGYKENYAYDAAGRTTEVIDSSGGSKRLIYNDRSQLKQVTDAVGQSTRYEYDPNQRLAKVTDARGSSTYYEYDANGRILVTTDGVGATTKFAYNNKGQLTGINSADGQTVTYDYGPNGLDKSITLAGDKLVASYSLDGFMEGMQSKTGTTKFEYDPITRMPTKVTEPDGRYVRYEYDRFGRRSTIATFSGTGPEIVTRYSYNSDGQISRVTNSDNGSTNYTYTNKKLTEVNRPNGIKSSYSYTASGQVESIIHSNAANQVVVSYRYGYDSSGNLISAQNADLSTIFYAYDKGDRLSSETVVDTNGNELSKTTYSYDNSGNITRRIDSSVVHEYTYNSLNQLVSGDGKVFTYDANGNIATETSTAGITRFTYDVLGRLTTIVTPAGERTEYGYDMDGNRISQKIAGVETRYLIDRFAPEGLTQVLAESSPDGRLIRAFLNLDSTSELSDANGRHFVLTDLIGSTRALANSTGEVTDRYNYSAFGKTLQHLGNSTNPIKFNGQQQDPSGLYYLRARYYDPATSRFLSRDSLRGELTKPISFAPYVYAANNPIKYGDPSGRVPTNLTELQSTIATQMQLRGEDLNNFRKGVKQTSEKTAEISRYFGGLLSVAAVIDSFNHLANDILFFGMQAPLGVINTGRIGMDMLGKRNVVFHFFDLQWVKNYQATFKKFAPVAVVKNFAGRANADSVDIAILPEFFYSTIKEVSLGAPAEKGLSTFLPRPPLPIAAQGLAGIPSMAGIMVHEFSHITLDTKDDGYFVPNLIEKDPLGFLISKLKDPTINADNYRAFVRANAIGFDALGNKVDKLRGAIEKFFNT